MKQFSFPKSSRLLTNSQFRAVYARRLSARDELLVLHARENGLGHSRLGVSIGKSCGTAVARNRLKRLLREVFRQNRHLISPDFDYVVSMSFQWVGRTTSKSFRPKTTAGAKNSTMTPKFEQIRDSFLTLAAKLASKRA